MGRWLAPAVGQGDAVDGGQTPAQRLDLTGRAVAVTGATGGIGRGIARRLSAAGARVLVHHRGSPDDALELCAQLPGEAVSVQADLLAEHGAPQLIEAGRAAFGHLDVLVNNAGIQPVAALTEVTGEAFDEVLTTNVTLAHRCTTAFAAHRRAQGGGGAVINIASIEAWQPAPGHAHYAASKAGLRMYTRAAALELAASGIRVNTVSPGLVERDGLAEQWPEGVQRWLEAVPLGRLATPDDIGDACVVLAGGLTAFVTGAELVVDGGMLARPTW